jgi:hypothetical protein
MNGQPWLDYQKKDEDEEDTSGKPWLQYQKKGSSSTGGRSEEEIFGAKKKEDDVEYGGVREGLATFLEGAVGAGDELDALYSRLTGEADSWDEAISGSRKRMGAFAKDNENLATALDWGGMAAGFIIPGAAVAKTGQALSKAQQAKRMMTIGAAEGAVYGGLSGEGTEGRLQGVAMGIGAGAAGGFLSSRLLAKNARSLRLTQTKQPTRYLVAVTSGVRKALTLRYVHRRASRLEVTSV